MTSNSLTENEEHDIPSHILKNVFGLHASVIFIPKYVCGFQSPVMPDPGGQLAELIAYVTSTRVDLYSHQMLLIHRVCPASQWKTIEKLFTISENDIIHIADNYRLFCLPSCFDRIFGSLIHRNLIKIILLMYWFVSRICILQTLALVILKIGCWRKLFSSQ